MKIRVMNATPLYETKQRTLSSASPRDEEISSPSDFRLSTGKKNLDNIEVL
jgi:hypothetical protein